MNAFVGLLYSKVRIGLLFLMLSCCFLSGCKATSTLQVDFTAPTQGKLALEIILDNQATSILQSESFNSISLDELFNLEEFRSAGFKVGVHVKSRQQAKIVISTSFSNEQELNKILSVFAPQEILRAKITTTKTYVSQHSISTITVDLTRLTHMYINNEKIKASLHEAGIEHQEYIDLITQAFDSTVIRVRLNSHGEKRAIELPINKPEKKMVSIETRTTNVKFIISIVLAILCLVCALLVLIKYRRSARVLLEQNKMGKTNG